jgi:hypothetical protein
MSVACCRLSPGGLGGEVLDELRPGVAAQAFVMGADAGGPRVVRGRLDVVVQRRGRCQHVTDGVDEHAQGVA